MFDSWTYKKQILIICHDVGVRCGGWGHIVTEFRMEDRKQG
jgi:hypothetical protein